MPTYGLNKRVRFDYEILETFEAGLVLTGPEVKSIRTNNLKLTGSYVVFQGEIPYLINLHIPRYKAAALSIPHESDRSRRLLLKKKEVRYLRGKSDEAGLTIVPVSVYTHGPHIKIEIALVRGKKTYDKREAIKKRDLNRELRRKE